MTDRIPTRFAINGDYDPIPDVDPSGFINWDLGYTFDYERRIGQDVNAKAVERLKMNYLFGIITENLKQWQDQGCPDWRGTAAGTDGITYVANAFVRYSVDGKVYRSLQAVPVNIPPTNATYWEEVPDNAYVTSISPMPAGGGLPENELIIVATDVNNLTNGTWEFSDAANSSANLPLALGGMLEAKRFEFASGQFAVVQRYTVRTGWTTNGVEYHRYYSGSSWSNWVRVGKYDDIPAPKSSPASINFDTTSIGTYHLTSAAFTASTGTKPSPATAGFLEVLNISGVVYQTFKDVSGSMYVRAKNGVAAFTPWIDQALTSKPGTAPEPNALSTQDLNAVLSPGFYIQTSAANATTARNYPENGSAGALLVQGNGSIGAGQSGVQQQYHCYASTRVYTRASVGTGWSAWALSYSTQSKPTPADIGAVNKSGDTMTGNLTVPALYGDYISAKRSNNPMFEWHIPSVHAAAAYLTTAGQLRFAVSNGAGGEVTYMMTLDGDGTVNSRGKMVSSFQGTRAWTEWGKSAFYSNGNASAPAGSLLGLITGAVNNPGHWNLEMGLGQFIADDPNNTAHVLWTTDGSTYTKYWQFYNNGGFASPSGAQFSGDGNVYGTIWGGWLHGYLGSTYSQRIHYAAEVGTYCFAALHQSYPVVGLGGTVPGTYLYPTAADEYGYGGTAPLPGSWRCMGNTLNANNDDRLDDRSTLWFRYA